MTGQSALASAARRTFPGTGPSALARQGRMVLAGLPEVRPVRFADS
ncbi:hypothetical protein [Tabrizicola sp.]